MNTNLENLICNYESSKAFWQIAPTVADNKELQPYFLRLMRQRNFVALLQDTEEQLREAAGTGNPWMQYAWARYQDILQPDAKANEIKEKYYTIAMHAGIADARMMLAYCYRDGDFGESDLGRYQREMRQALDEGSEWAAQQMLRDMIFGQYGMKADPEKAYQDVSKFIAGSEARGESIDGLYYHIKADAAKECGRKDEANALYEEAATKHGDSTAFFPWAIGTSCDENMTVTDDERFIEIMEKARNAYSSDGFFDYCYLVTEEEFETLPEETQKSITASLKDDLDIAASMGDSFGALFMAIYYQNGSMGFEQDDAKAWSWYARGAVLGNAQCYYSMADMILEFHTAPEHYDESFAYECRYRALMLGDKDSLKIVIEGYRKGFLTEHAGAIEFNWLPQYEDSGFEEYDDPEYLDDPEEELEEDDVTEGSEEEAPEPDNVMVKGSPEEIESHWQASMEAVDQAQKLADEKAPAGQFAEIVDEYAEHAAYLGEYEHMLNKIYVLNDRMLNILQDKPELRLKVLRVHEDILQYIEALEHHDLMILEEVRREIQTLDEQLKK